MLFWCSDSDWGRTQPPLRSIFSQLVQNGSWEAPIAQMHKTLITEEARRLLCLSTQLLARRFRRRYDNRISQQLRAPFGDNGGYTVQIIFVHWTEHQQHVLRENCNAAHCHAGCLGFGAEEHVTSVWWHDGAMPRPPWKGKGTASAQRYGCGWTVMLRSSDSNKNTQQGVVSAA